MNKRKSFLEKALTKVNKCSIIIRTNVLARGTSKSHIIKCIMLDYSVDIKCDEKQDDLLNTSVLILNKSKIKL